MEFLYLDLGSFKDVRAFVEEIKKRVEAVDLLVNSETTLNATLRFFEECV